MTRIFTTGGGGGGSDGAGDIDSIEKTMKKECKKKEFLNIRSIFSVF